VGERYLDTVEVTGSIPVSPTRIYAGKRLDSSPVLRLALELALQIVGPA
jgi:hypothetical protein